MMHEKTHNKVNCIHSTCRYASMTHKKTHIIIKCSPFRLCWVRWLPTIPTLLLNFKIIFYLRYGNYVWSGLASGEVLHGSCDHVSVSASVRSDCKSFVLFHSASLRNAKRFKILCPYDGNISCNFFESELFNGEPFMRSLFPWARAPNYMKDT